MFLPSCVCERIIQAIHESVQPLVEGKRQVGQSTAAALIAAGLISVVAFPALAFRLLERRPAPA